MSTEEPPVYLATYSNTEVYESIINECPLMRRCKDDWVNATQILKCCNFPKAKRTKILEKGVQQGMHQKIQGGYGRFQGTWIPLPDAQRLATGYGMNADMAPVLFFDPANPGFQLSKKAKDPPNKDGTPVKRKYVKKKKPDGTTPKKFKRDDQFSEFNQTDSFNSVSRMPSHLSSFSNGGSMPVQYPVNGSFVQQDYMPGSQNMAFNPNAPMNNDYQSYQMQMQMQMQQPPQPQVPQSQFNYGYSQQQQQQQQQQQPQQQPMNHPQFMGSFHHSKMPSSQSTNETTWSQDENNKESDTSLSSNEEMKKPKESYAAQLLKFFSEENGAIPYFVHNPPYDFNINEAIDDEGHTPLHWAASIGNYMMIHLLMSKGANPLVVNNFGLNPLSKLISFNNCFELKNFPKVLDDLEICLINTDINGRTPLHYLCQFSKVPSKYDSLRYYMGMLLGKLTSMNNQSANNKSINLLKNVLDHQDVNGDTSLHLAAKAGCSRLVKYLLSYNARDDLYNVNQETAKQIIMRDNLLASKDSPPHSEPTHIDTIHPTSHLEVAAPIKQLSTPTQSRSNVLETPDTQRTTLQDDDDDDHHRNARVDKEQLNQLLKSTVDDDKENIFLDSMKPFDSMSTPIQATKSHSYLGGSLTHQPLAVISERTAESTPMAVDPQGHESIKAQIREDDSPESYLVKPPSLDEDGNIVEATLPEVLFKVDDISQMVSVMVKSLADSYKDSMRDLEEEESNVRKQISEKEASNEKLLYNSTFSLTKIGIDEVSNLSDADASMTDFALLQETLVKNKETVLANKLEKVQAFQLASLVSSNEQLSDEDDSISNDHSNKFGLAVELSSLQIERSGLLSRLTEKIKLHGIDDKMYKYRKLISLSCGLNVEEIDCLIDGIEESLMETSGGKA
ncbi:transcription factor [Yamadazyma tenuis]|uniref:HTH APSES-type domain-containing protein n=1 Tax=Candida tenuis (strain ATCC 10573 / BCRC 21748 / CBS 615 / JCM 9827 / NBRC 10315 / NRRL Y-1498 / VKM Y-70) TaxID=590646 RepID=G3AZF5_CANTC|nr:uncharacterized protein CANTEDRAFT_102423 [Yamadazyma tenuis ATCC 10573]EGV66082.1 hypothetical protein CANTEDRAFT_102423 [Yamadazyma tenuis ATCC 10573]WEJ95568.1 transcription factor [Yamadazyma tenuis]